MERLQAALQKAREQRQGQPSARPKSVQRRSVDENWNALERLTPDLKLWQRNRIVAAKGGEEAAAYDLLRTKLLRLSRQNGWKRIAIVSPAAAAGKSTTMLNLAFAFSRQKDVRAILCDFDLRRPSIARLLGYQCDQNMGDVLSHQASFASHAVRYEENLIFALNSGATRNSAELLQSQETDLLLREVEQDYACDLMLFDMPPLLVADDAHGFLRCVDAALIVMESEKTPIKQIDVVERQVAELTNVAGIVLNKCNYPDDLYGGGYNSYY